MENVIRRGQYEIWMHQSETNRMGFLHWYWCPCIRNSLGRLHYLITILFYQNWRFKWNCINIFWSICLPVIFNNFDFFSKTTLVIITRFDTRHPLLKSQSGSAVGNDSCCKGSSYSVSPCSLVTRSLRVELKNSKEKKPFFFFSVLPKNK